MAVIIKLIVQQFSTQHLPIGVYLTAIAAVFEQTRAERRLVKFGLICESDEFRNGTMLHVSHETADASLIRVA